jgi:hypothetical protein
VLHNITQVCVCNWETNLLTNIVAFRNVAPCSLVKYADVSEILAASAMLEAGRTSETSVNFYQITRCYTPEDTHLHTRRHDNLKSHEIIWRIYIYTGGSTTIEVALSRISTRKLIITVAHFVITGNVYEYHVESMRQEFHYYQLCLTEAHTWTKYYTNGRWMKWRNPNMKAQMFTNAPRCRHVGSNANLENEMQILAHTLNNWGWQFQHKSKKRMIFLY